MYDWPVRTTNAYSLVGDKFGRSIFSDSIYHQIIHTCTINPSPSYQLRVHSACFTAISFSHSSYPLLCSNTVHESVTTFLSSSLASRQKSSPNSRVNCATQGHCIKTTKSKYPAVKYSTSLLFPPPPSPHSSPTFPQVQISKNGLTKSCSASGLSLSSTSNVLSKNTLAS